MEPSITNEPAQPMGFSAPPVDEYSFGYGEVRDPRACQTIGFRKGRSQRRRSMYPSSQAVPTNLVEQAGPARPVFRAHPSQSHAAHIPVPSARHPQPAPLPKRPKGQVFVATTFFFCMILGAYVIWNGAFRFQAYGLVRGRVLEVAPEWEGIIAGIHVRDGENVSQGQPLFTIVNDELEQSIRVIEEELRTTAATLDAEIYEIRWQSETKDDAQHLAAAEYHQRIADLEAERTLHARLKAELKRLRTLKDKNPRAVKPADLEALEIADVGKERRIDALSESVGELKSSSDTELDPEKRALFTFKSKRARIDGLELKMERLREQLTRGLVRSPVEGRVIKKRRFTGEFAKQGEPVLEIMEDGSARVSVFLPQRKVGQIEIGQGLDVQILSTGATVVCEVVRLGDELEPAPSSIQRFYRRDEPLLAVDVEMPLHLREKTLPLGSLVRVPNSVPLSETISRWIGVSW